MTTSELKKLGVPLVVTVAYRRVRGAAKQYPYCGAKLYYADVRRDGKTTFRPLGFPCCAPDRRSKRLAKQDAIEASKRIGIPFVPSIRLGSIAPSMSLTVKDLQREAIYSNDNH